MSLHNCKVLSREPPPPIDDSNWYTDPLGHTRNWETHAQLGDTCDWESLERCMRSPGCALDGVGIIAVLERSGSEPGLLLQKQFRLPIGKVCVEVPAGLVEERETPEECALRELWEETGYRGVVVDEEGGLGGRSALMFNDPGMCNTNLHFVYVKIDLTDPQNQNPKQRLEENEFIECFTVPLKDLYSTCRQMEREGLAIDARVGTLAEGFEIARKWRFL